MLPLRPHRAAEDTPCACGLSAKVSENVPIRAAGPLADRVGKNGIVVIIIVAVNLGGGTHHAFTDRGQGYCLLNDAAIASRALQAENIASKILIVDCDVHQGNGTAAIFKNDPSVFTFSIHGKNNFPYKKERSDLDIALEDETGDGHRTKRGRRPADVAVFREPWRFAPYGPVPGCRRAALVR